MEGMLFERMEQYDYENLYFCQDKSVGLKAVIAIHNTILGPAAGGTRMWTYAVETDAIVDAMRLARAMTYKLAAVEANFGGGKCVVIGDARRDKSDALLHSLGRFVHRLHGLFLTGVDVGTTARDFQIMRQETPYVVLEAGGGGLGESAVATAFGVVQGMRACLNAVYGSPDPQGRHVTVQGIGAVGRDVVRRLVEAGASVTITDIDREAVARVATDYDVKVAAPEEIHRLPVDVYCPCALGAVLNDQSIPELRCRIVCGSANNQLGEERHGDMLVQRDILYAPDFIVNAGGSLSHLDTFNPGGFNLQRVEAAIARVYETMERLIALSRERQIPTYRAAAALAEQRIEKAREQLRH